MKQDVMTRVVQLPSRGQITIPAEFRRLLGLDEGDLLRLSLKEGRIEIEPLAVEEGEQLRQYTEVELRQFMEEDRIDAQTAEAVRTLLTAGVL